MLVPRALRLKGVKEPPKSKPAIVESPKDAAKRNETLDGNQAKSLATKDKEANGPGQASRHQDLKPGTKGSRFTTTPITPEYLAQLLAGVELIFTDYAHQDPESAKWLQERYRKVDGELKFIHLAAILVHQHIAGLKPQPTQILLQRALQEVSTDYLELSKNGFYVRRKPSTYPSSWVPANSFSVTDDNGLSYWDQRTIYVEPHIRHLCKTPAKVAHWLKEHGELKPKWLPVQAVHTLYNSCAFVVISGNVLHEKIWKKWRDRGKPEDWKIMTKVEHTKRTEEYLELLKENNAWIKQPRPSPSAVAAAKESSSHVGAADDRALPARKKLKLTNYPLE